MLEVHRLSIRYTLTALRPTPQRLRQLVAAFARWGCTGLYIDWGDSFPWGIDERFHAPDAYPEDLVVGLTREATERGIALNSVFPAPDALDALANVASYRRLFRWSATGPVLRLATPAGRSFYGELIDDYLRLLPDASEILIDCRPDVVAVRHLAGVVRPYRDQGLRVLARYAGAADRISGHLPELLGGFDRVALPLADAVEWAQEHPGRLICTVSTQAEGDAHSRVGLPGGPGESLPLLLSFQPEGRTAEALLGGTIEGKLDAVHDAVEHLAGRKEDDRQGERPEGVETISAAGLTELERSMEATLVDGWHWVRLVREALRGESTAAVLTPLLESLAEAYRRAVGVAGELQRCLAEIVDAPRLRREMGKLLGALFEEHLELCGRAGILVEAPRPEGFDGRLENDRFSC